MIRTGARGSRPRRARGKALQQAFQKVLNGQKTNFACRRQSEVAIWPALQPERSHAHNKTNTLSRTHTPQ